MVLRRVFHRAAGSRQRIIDDMPVRNVVLAALAAAAMLTAPRAANAQECDLYKRLMTTHDGAYARDVTGGAQVNVCGQTWLFGVIRESIADDLSCATGYAIEAGTCPTPQVALFESAHWGNATNVPSGGASTFNLSAPSGQVAFFKTDTDPDNTGYSVFAGDPDPELHINVQGTVIWMLDHGLRSNTLVKVSGTASDCLVIVSGKNEDMSIPTLNSVGIWFFAGIQSSNVPVILVTDGEVRAEHFNNTTGGTAFSLLPYASIFAQHAVLGGPAAPNYLRFYHDPASPYDAPGGLIDALCLHGLLPNTEGPPVANPQGTWGRLKVLYR